MTEDDAMKTMVDNTQEPDREPEPKEQFIFSPHDHCDRCIQTPAVAVTKMSTDKELTLMFCNHHSHRYAPHLIGQGWTFYSNPAVEQW